MKVIFYIMRKMTFAAGPDSMASESVFFLKHRFSTSWAKVRISRSIAKRSLWKPIKVTSIFIPNITPVVGMPFYVPYIR
jgi:hypothetical protein